jgi:plastocyanin
MRRYLLLSSLALLPLLAACGGGGGGDESAKGGGGTNAVASACPEGAVVIHMKNIKFDPETANAKVGQKVCWINDDDVDHDVYEDVGPRSGSAPAFSSPDVAPGHRFRFVTGASGTIRYVCTLHPTVMAGRIVVTRRARRS